MDTLILLACEVAIEILLFVMGMIPAVQRDFLEGCHAVIKWIAVATLAYLGVDSIAQMLMLRWRSLAVKNASALTAQVPGEVKR